ncbi:hypothetical protein F5Y03DRAFT_138937 [Xylaria venustula]|nr:hypothetical protein F5Y03DRAFT_138937 [Xylaria venustula]
MFTCRACLTRAFDALSVSRSPNISRYSLPSLRATAKSPRSRRRYATVAAHARSADTEPLGTPQSPNDEHVDNKAPIFGRSADWAARKELQYLGDPLHIANRVRLALNQDHFDLAARITRQASRTHNVTVSWNHLIDYQLQNGRIHVALKLYNEMKKRAQQPNAQTFTIIFRGCAKSEHPKLALGEAIKLYQNMLSVGRIKPNTIHLNAVLQVCAKCGDLESMFSLLNSSDDPLRSPNNLTYTTIFNAMRMATEQDLADNINMPIDRMTKTKIQETIQRARAIWEEVLSRWRSGSLIIDEELVCAMGRVLLMGGYRDIDAIEGLIEQTMMIERKDNKGLPEGAEGDSTALALPRSTIKAPGAPPITHALPGNNSLSMILEALEKTRRTTQAVKYWNVFTLHHHVVPDAENWVRIFRVYHVGKNSARAASALESMPPATATHKHVRIAMKTCLRDNLNKSAFDNATKILNTMGKHLSTPDIQSLRTYLQVAHASKRSFDRQAVRDYSGAMDSWAKKLHAALEQIFEPYQLVAKKHVIEAPNTSEPKVLEQMQNSKAEVVALARKMCAAYDILTNEHPASLSEAQLATIKSRHGGLTRLINDYFQRQGQYLHKSTEKRGNFEDNRSEQRDNKFDQKYDRFKKRGDPRRSKPRQWGDVDDEAFEQKFSNRAV